MQAQCADPSSVLPLKEFWFSVSLNNFNKLLNQLIKNAVLTACMGFINDKCQKNSSYYFFLVEFMIMYLYCQQHLIKIQLAGIFFHLDWP